MPDNKEKIAEVDRLLESGLTSASSDGLSFSYQSRKDLMALRRQLVEEDTTNSYKKRRPVISINLGGF